MRSYLLNLKRKTTAPGGFTTSLAIHELAMNRLQSIIDYPADLHKDANTDSNDESSVASTPLDFYHGDNTFHKSSIQE